MRYLERMIRGDVRRPRANGCKRMGTVAAQNARQFPEALGYHSHPDAGRPPRIERLIVIVTHAGHHQSARRSQGVAERGNQAQRPLFDGCDVRKRRVDEQDATALDAERTKVLGHGSEGNGLTRHHGRAFIHGS